MMSIVAGAGTSGREWISIIESGGYEGGSGGGDGKTGIVLDIWEGLGGLLGGDRSDGEEGNGSTC